MLEELRFSTSVNLSTNQKKEIKKEINKEEATAILEEKESEIVFKIIGKKNPIIILFFIIVVNLSLLVFYRTQNSISYISMIAIGNVFAIGSVLSYEAGRTEIKLRRIISKIEHYNFLIKYFEYNPYYVKMLLFVSIFSLSLPFPYLGINSMSEFIIISALYVFLCSCFIVIFILLLGKISWGKIKLALVASGMSLNVMILLSTFFIALNIFYSSFLLTISSFILFPALMIGLLKSLLDIENSAKLFRFYKKTYPIQINFRKKFGNLFLIFLWFFFLLGTLIFVLTLMVYNWEFIYNELLITFYLPYFIIIGMAVFSAFESRLDFNSRKKVRTVNWEELEEINPNIQENLNVLKSFVHEASKECGIREPEIHIRAPFITEVHSLPERNPINVSSYSKGWVWLSHHINVSENALKKLVGNTVKERMKAMIYHEFYHLSKNTRKINFLEFLSTFTISGKPFLAEIIDLSAEEFRADEFAAHKTSKETVTKMLNIDAVDMGDEINFGATFSINEKLSERNIFIRLYKILFKKSLIGYYHPSPEERKLYLEEVCQ